MIGVSAESDPKKVAIVTGGARGIGAAACEALAQQGFRVMIHYRTNSEAAGRLHEAVCASGGTAEQYSADLTNPEEVDALIARTKKLWGGVGVLCNNAGVNQHRELADITLADWRTVMEANLLSCFLTTQAVIPLMLRQGWGRIINLSSAAAYVAGQPCRGAHYAAAKAAVSAFGRCLASEYAEHGITINTVAPGAIATERSLAIRTDQEIAERAQRVPVGRVGDPSEIGATVAFLASDAAGFMTGQTLHVNGGTHFGM